VIESIVGLVTLFLTVAIVGVVAGGVAMALWLVFLPFRILGWAFKAIGFLLALPFLLIFGLIGVVLFGVGALVFVIPFAPFLLLSWLVWRWMRGRPRATVSA